MFSRPLPAPSPTGTTTSPRARTVLRATLAIIALFALLLGLGALAGALLGLFAPTGGGTGLDTDVLRAVVARRASDLTPIVRMITDLGGTAVITPLTAGVALVLLLVRRWQLAAYLLIVSVGASLLSATTKAIVGRARPPVGLRLAGVGDSAFPSGHATQAAATYTALAVIVTVLVVSPRIRAVAWTASALVILAVGWSRLYLGVHWLTDVVGGWLLGAAWAMGVAVACGLCPVHWRRRRSRRHPPGDRDDAEPGDAAGRSA